MVLKPNVSRVEYDVELSCGPVVMDTVQKYVTTYQNETHRYKIRTVKVVHKPSNWLNSHAICKNSYFPADTDVNTQ